jgi:hypothetical protein
MSYRKPIALNSLSVSHSDEISRLLAGIRGDADATLWTADLRAATRGGKCQLIGVAIDEPAAD